MYRSDNGDQVTGGCHCRQVGAGTLQRGTVRVTRLAAPHYIKLDQQNGTTASRARKDFTITEKALVGAY